MKTARQAVVRPISWNGLAAGRALALAVVLCGPLLAVAVVAQEHKAATQAPRVAYLGWAADPTDRQAYHEALRRGLRELGYVEGRGIALEFRQGTTRQLPELAAELVRQKVDVIVAGGTPAARAAQRATSAIPIVMVLVSDPVASGLVTSLARPGGNITGLSLIGEEVVPKGLELLKEAVPRTVRVAVFLDSTNAAHVMIKNRIDAVAAGLGVQAQPTDVRTATDLDGAFANVLRQRAGALLILPLTLTATDERRVAQVAVKHRLPTMAFTRRWLDAGVLMLYAPDFADQVRRSATYVDKILKGTKPAELPVEQATKIDLTINLKTARALGLTVPPSLLLRADRVVE